MVKTLQRDPFRDLGQYLSPGPLMSTIDDPFLEKCLNNPHMSDTTKMLSLTENLPKTELTACFA